MYIHIPFCRRRCGYCDFNTFAGLSHLIPAYVKALRREIELTADRMQDVKDIHTIFFGGGTPSLLTPDQINTILNCVRENFRVTGDAEITMEANPGTVSEESMRGYADAGVNRTSFGLQSASDEDLRLLSRQHSYLDVIKAVTAAKKAGITRINLDLIFGIPGQTLERWKWSLQMALNLGVEHFSLYSLIVEEGTPLYNWVEKGLVQEPDDDLAAEMYEYAGDLLTKNGYQQYEISNWARGEAARCRHNLQYWHYEPFLGFGAGATGFIGNRRIENVSGVEEYLHAVGDAASTTQRDYPAAREVTQLSQWDRMQEEMMVGLRLTDEGVSVNGFERKYAAPLDRVFHRQIQLLIGEGLLEYTSGEDRHLRLTHRGRLLGNQVFLQFVGNPIPDCLVQGRDQ